ANLLDQQLEPGGSEDLGRSGPRNQDPGAGCQRIPAGPGADVAAASGDPLEQRTAHRLIGKRGARLGDGWCASLCIARRGYVRDRSAYGSFPVRESNPRPVTLPVYLSPDLPHLDAASALAEKV